MKVLNALLQLTSTAIVRHARGIFTLLITAVAVNVCLRIHRMAVEISCPCTSSHATATFSTFLVKGLRSRQER